MPVNSPMIEIEYVEAEAASEPEPTEADRQEDEVTRIQAMSEGVSTAKTIDFMGKPFRPAGRIGLMPLMKFSHLAANGLDTDTQDEAELMAAMDSIYTLIKDAIHEDDWNAFEAHAIEMKAMEEDLMDVVRNAIEVMTARPTQPPSDSSSPPPPTGRTSTPGPSAKARALGLVPVGDLLE